MIVDLDMGQIPRSIKSIFSLVIRVILMILFVIIMMMMSTEADLEFKVGGQHRDAGGVETENPKGSRSVGCEEGSPLPIESGVWRAVPLPRKCLFFSVKMACFGASCEAFVFGY